MEFLPREYKEQHAPNSDIILLPENHRQSIISTNYKIYICSVGT